MSGWVEGLPTEPGDYWFYEPNLGSESPGQIVQGRAFIPGSGGLMSVAHDYLRPERFNKTTKRIWHKPLVLPDRPEFDHTCPTCKDAHEWAKERCYDCRGTGEIS